jgi:lactoylglutathione lyase
MENDNLKFSEKNAESDFSDFKAGHVGIRTTEYKDLLKWYKENLDFRVIYEWIVGELQLAFIAPPNDNSFIIEVIGEKSSENSMGSGVKFGYDHLSFNVENLDTTIEHLKIRNININRSFSVPAIGKRVAFIADPFGNIIEFCEDIK